MEQIRTFIYWLILSIVLLCDVDKIYASSSPAAIRQLTYTEGLKGEDVNKIYKDSRGLIWIATNRGVNCYNGHSVIPFRIDMSSSVVTQVKEFVELPNGTIYTATDCGIYSIDLAETDCKRQYHEIMSANAMCLVGDIIVVGANNGIYLCPSPKSSKYIPIEANIIAKNNQVNSVTSVNDSIIWFCTNDRVGRLKLPSMSLEMYDIDHNLFIGNLSTICHVGEVLFVGTEGSGVLKLGLCEQTLQASRYSPISCMAVNELSATGDSLLHVCSDALYTVDVRTDSLIDVRRSEIPGVSQPNGIYTYLHDEELGVDWMGYFVEGLSYRYHTHPLFATYKMGSFDTYGINVRSFCINDNNILIGTREGLYCINEKRHTVRHFTSEELGASVVTNIVRWGEQFVLATFGGGVLAYNPVAERLERATLPVDGNFSRLVITPDSTSLIAASNLGIYIIDKDLRITKHYNSYNSELPNAHIPDVRFDQVGKAWISTLKGMAIYDPRTETIQASGFPHGYFNHEPNLSFNPSLDGDVIAFSTNKVYKASSDLSSYDSLALYTNPNVGAINFILPFADSLYWVGANNGLFLFDKHLQHFTQFNESDGLPSLRFSKQEYAYTPDGTLWMATNKGLAYLTPEAQGRLAGCVEGKTIMKEMLIDERQQPAGSLISLIDKQKIILRWNFVSELLTFTPLLLDFSYPSIRYYEYSLDGATYRNAGSENVVTLRKLSLGKHILCIRQAGREETETEYQIQVVPSSLFYFELLFIITLAITLYSINRWIKYRHCWREKMREKHELELYIASENAIRLYEERQSAQRREADEAKQRERDRRVSSKEYKELYRRVREYMDLEKPYKRSSFGLSDLAAAVGSSPTMLSLMLNQRASTTFYDFVAHYRVEEFKRMATSEKFAHLTVTAISERCGFKKSTFFATFKRIEHCTPAEWLANAKK